MTKGLERVFIAFASPEYGLLVWAPWILVRIVAVFRTAHTYPDWARLLVPAGLVYIVVHVQINRVSGGLP